MSYVDMDAGGAQLYKNPPYFFSQTVTSNINGLPPVTLSDGLPTPVPPSVNNPLALSAGNLNAWAYNLKETKILQWNIGVQRELGKGFDAGRQLRGNARRKHCGEFVEPEPVGSRAPARKRLAGRTIC